MAGLVRCVSTRYYGRFEWSNKQLGTVEVRRKAIQVALCIACGAFQTGLLSYFTHRDLFPALMKVCCLRGFFTFIFCFRND